MAAVDIFDVKVLDNPAPFTNPLQFEITYDVREALKEDIEWKVIYVGSAEDQSRDQELDSVLVPAEAQGRFKFVLQVDPPNPAKIPDSDIAGVTIVLLTCSYENAEFVRVGYYVSNEYPTPELNENPPSKPIIDQITRTIAATDPRVTKFPHKFDFSQPLQGTSADPELSTDGAHFAAGAASGQVAYFVLLSVAHGAPVKKYESWQNTSQRRPTHSPLKRNVAGDEENNILHNREMVHQTHAKSEKKMQNVVKAPTCPEWISSLHKAFLQNGFNHTASALIDDGGMDPSKVEAAFEEICRVVDIHRKKKGLGKKKSAWDLYTKLEGNGAPASPSESSEAESSEEEDESSSESDSDSTSNKKAAVKLNNVLQVAKAKPKAESESESESGSGSESKSDSESESESNSESSSSEDDVQKDAHRHREQLRGKQAKKSEKNVPTPASSSSESSSSSSEESSGSEEDDSSQSSSDESVELKRPGLGSGIGNIPKVTTKARDKTAGSGKAQTASSASADSSESEDSENSESTGSDSDSSSDSDSVKSSDSDSSSSDSDSSEDDSSSPESGTEEEKRAARRRSGVVQNLAAKLQNVTPSPKNALNKSKREKRKSQDRSDVSSDDVVKEDKIGGKENTSTEVQFPRSEQKRKASSASLDGDAFINNKRRRRNENFNGRFTPSPFKRVREETVVYSDSRLRDNTFYSKNDTFGVRAHNDLIVTKGKGFRKEKTKKKRLNHHGGTLSYQVNSFKFADDSD